MIVVDSSLALTWCFRDEQTPASAALLARVATEGFLVPMLWHLEIANVLQLAVRRKRITSELRDASLADLAQLPIHVDDQTIDRAWSSTVKFAQRYDLTAYDASYLELAMRRNLPLATLDEALIAAGPRAGVAILPVPTAA